MNWSTKKIILFAITLPLLAASSPGLDKYSNAFKSARTKMYQRDFAEALSDVDVCLKHAAKQSDIVNAMMLRAQILQKTGKITEAVAEYRKIIEDINSDTHQKFAAYRHIAQVTLRNRKWAKKRDVYADARCILNDALKLPGLTSIQKFTLSMDHVKTYEAAKDWQAVINEMEELLKKPDLTNDQSAEVLSRIVHGAIQTGQSNKKDLVIKEIQKFPVNRKVISILGSIASEIARNDLPNAEAILRNTLKKKKLTDALKLQLLQQILRLHLNKSKYEVYKPMMDAILKTAKNKNLKPEMWTINQFATKAAKASDFGTAEKCYREIIKIQPNYLNAYFGAAEMAMIRGDTTAAQANLQKIIKNPKYPAYQRYIARIINLAIRQKTAQTFRQDIVKADKEFASEKFSKEQRFKFLRQASLRLFKMYRYDNVRALEAETASMMCPEKEKIFVCHYAEDVPRNADSWARSPLLKESRYQESRFEKYANLNDNLKSDISKLRRQDTATNKKGYDTRVYIVYDKRGVHIYVKCDDPEARKIEQGLIDAGSLEMYFQPGKDHAYHQWFFELPGKKEPHLVNWDTPHRHYRYTYDYMVKDTVVTDKGMGAYTFIPWRLVYDKLPSESNKWIFSMQRWTKGGSVTLGGAVHELGRAVELNFAMPKPLLLAIKREITIRAYAEYKKKRKRPAGVLIWQDPELGDPEFYNSMVEPLLEKLDKAGEKVIDKMTDDDVEDLFNNVVPAWLELKYNVAELRNQYLKNKIFNEEI